MVQMSCVTLPETRWLGDRYRGGLGLTRMYKFKLTRVEPGPVSLGSRMSLGP